MTSVSVLYVGMHYLTTASWQEALDKEKKKITDLEKKYNDKLKERSVSSHTAY